MEVTTADLSDLEVLTKHIMTRLTRSKLDIANEILKSNHDLSGPVHKRAKLTIKSQRASE